MRFQEIQKMAKNKGVKPYRMNKLDTIRAIQRAERNIDCYATGRIEHCHEMECLWRMDCMNAVNSGRN